uniref:Uncharacterized protein n=1 Tax=Sus scrofa TaxID=9823 RepID=A0A8D1K6B2_PIG
MTRRKPREKCLAQTSKDPCHSASGLEMDLTSPSSMAKQAMEAMETGEDPAGEVILGPSVLANSQTSEAELRRAGFPATSTSLSPLTKPMAQDPKEPCLQTQVASKVEQRGLVKAKKQPRGHATGDILNDTHTDGILQDYATGMLLQDAVPDVLLAADILAFQSSLSNVQREYASEDRPASQVPYTLKGSEHSSQGQQKSIKPKLRDPYNSQDVMLAPTDERRGFTRLQSEEHKKSKSSQGQEQPQNPKVRDPYKGQMVSDDEEEVCEWLLSEDDDETKGQREMFPPTKEWQGFKRPKPKAHKESWRERFAPNDERRGFTRLQPEEYEEKFSGLSASQANGVSHPPKVKERGESLGNKDLQFSPGKEQILLESNFRRRMKHFLQCVNPHKKSKGTETVLQKGKPVSLTAPGQQPVKGRSGDPEAEVTGTVTGQHLGEQLGLRQDLQPSELNQHTQQLQPPAGGQSNHQKVRAFLEEKRLLRNRVHGCQTTPKDHSSLNSGGTKDKGSKWTSPPKDLETPGRPHQQGPTVAGTSGHLHHHPTCSLQKCPSAGQPGCAPQAFPGRKIQSMLRKPVSPSC